MTGAVVAIEIRTSVLSPALAKAFMGGAILSGHPAPTIVRLVVSGDPALATTDVSAVVSRAVESMAFVPCVHEDCDGLVPDHDIETVCPECCREQDYPF